MLALDMDLKGLNAQIDRTILRVRQAALDAMMRAFREVIEATPEDTGFLRASWYVVVDGRRSADPPPPDYDLKREHDYGRPFRSLPPGVPKSGGGRDVFLGDSIEFDELPKPEPEFVDHYSDIRAHFRLIRRRTLKQPFIRSFEFRNAAPYVEQVQAREPLQETAAILARNAIITRLRAESRRQRAG